MPNSISRFRKDWTGEQCGLLTVISEIPAVSGINIGPRWMCKCVCGKEKIIRANHLKQTRSCGCLLYKRGEDKTLVTQNFYYAMHKANATRRGHIPLERTAWDKITKQQCYYCGNIDSKNIADSHIYKHTCLPLSGKQYLAYRINLNGIDRLNNQLGYDLTNIVPCCEMCNKMKLKSTENDFLDHLYKIHKHQQNPSVVHSNLMSKYASKTLDYQYRVYKDRAIRSGYIYLDRLSWENLVLMSCHYCGEFDTREVRSSEQQKNSSPSDYRVYMNGIDRVDSSLGYTLDNAVPCCIRCNRSKLDWPKNDFLNQVNRIINNQ